jgi:hypothetical protein
VTEGKRPNEGKPHVWFRPPNVSFDVCRFCLTVRQADGSSDAKPCRGRARLSLRGEGDL